MGDLPSISARTMRTEADSYAIPKVAISDLMGIPVSSVGGPQILDFMATVIAENRRAVILHVNICGANLAARHPWLKQYFKQAELVFCDGDGVRLGLWILGFTSPPKVTYNVFLWQLAASCEERGFSLYLLGARPGVAGQAARNLQNHHPNLRILGTHHGYFAKQDPQNDAVVAEINHLKPDVLLVCFGMPIQEQWVRENSGRLAVHIILTGGAALDYGAGLVPVAPAWMVRFHLEWFYRFLLEPLRLFNRYTIGNPRFIVRVLIERLFSNSRQGEQATE